MQSSNRNHRSTASISRESGQMLLIFVLFLTTSFVIAAVVVDFGLWLTERRRVQTAADLAALAAGPDLYNSDAETISTGLDFAGRNGYNNADPDVWVTITPRFNGDPTLVEVIIQQTAPTLFLDIFGLTGDRIGARAVAEVIITGDGGGSGGSDPGGGDDPGGGGGGGDPPIGPQPFAQVPISSGCSGSDNAVVDGRVTPGEGYEKFSDLVGSDLTNFGAAYFACDAGFLYFALELNSVDTGGAVANENVYACKGGAGGSAQLKNGLWKIKGPIETIGVSSFTIVASGATWTIDVDGSTKWRDNLDDFSDLTVGMFVEAKNGVELGPNHVLAGEVKNKEPKASGCGPGDNDTYHQDFDTGWVQSPKGAHDFKDLINSDRARFQTSCGGVVLHDFVQDYLRSTGPTTFASDAAGNGEVIVAAPTDSASSLEWNLEHPFETGWGDDPGEVPFIPGEVKPVSGQSPPFNPSYPNYDAEYDGWVWEMIYEFRIPRAPYECGGEVLFGLPDFTGSSGPVGGLHSSPAKIDTGVFVGFGGTRSIRLVE